MVLLIPDAVRKIKEQGRQEARRIIEDAVLEYRRREGIGMDDPIPVPVIHTIIDDAFARHDAARNAKTKTNACCR